MPSLLELEAARPGQGDVQLLLRVGRQEREVREDAAGRCSGK